MALITLTGLFRIASVVISVAIINYYMVACIVVALIVLFILNRIAKSTLDTTQNMDSVNRGPIH